MVRVYHIHEAVAEGRLPNCSSLARELEVTAKTIQRDVNFMREELKLPLVYDEQLHGYSYTQDVSDFPVFMMRAEDLAGLFLTRMALDSVRGTELYDSLRGVFARMTQGLEEEVRFSWSDAGQAFSRKVAGVTRNDLKLFGNLADAVMKRKEVTFSYRKLGDTTAVTRRVQPYHLGEVENCWYLIAHDLERDALRTFALPRMTRLKVLNTDFVKARDFNGEDYLGQSFGVWSAAKGEALQTVKVELRDYAAGLAQERRWHPSQTVKVLNDAGTRVEVSFEVGRFEDLLRWVLSWGSKARVLAPPEFKKRVTEEVRLMGKSGI